MNRRSLARIGSAATALLGLLLMVWAGLHWLLPTPAPVTPAVPEAVTAQATPVSPPAPAGPASAAPVTEPPVQVAAAPVMDAGQALRGLFGPKVALKIFLLDDFARRVVATVDGLGRSHVSSSLWPVAPTEGRFEVDSRGGSSVIAADNGLRYAKLLLVFENVDMRRLAALYRSLEPQFQQSYVDLGYPGRRFDHRLVEVIDLLLSTPEAPGPVHVHRPEIQGSIPVPRPWVLYEFDDPSLQSLSAGQKILLRMGPVDMRRSKRLLAQFRKLMATPLSEAH